MYFSNSDFVSGNKCISTQTKILNRNYIQYKCKIQLFLIANKKDQIANKLIKEALNYHLIPNRQHMIKSIN